MGFEHRLLVEGPEDQHVLYHLLAYLNVPKNVTEVQPLGGVASLLAELPTFLKADDVNHLGIVVDSDSNPMAHWQAIRQHLIAAGYQPPTMLPSTGGIMPAPRTGLAGVGVWLMPNNTTPGAIEDFIATLRRASDTLWDHAAGSVDALPRDQRRFCRGCETKSIELCERCPHKMKAYLHTWLAWQEDPGTPLGQAITKRYFDPTSSAAQPFLSWLRRLFDL